MICPRCQEEDTAGRDLCIWCVSALRRERRIALAERPCDLTGPCLWPGGTVLIHRDPTDLSQWRATYFKREVPEGETEEQDIPILHCGPCSFGHALEHAASHADPFQLREIKIEEFS